jgi:hypothetical protein
MSYCFSNQVLARSSSSPTAGSPASIACPGAWKQRFKNFVAIAAALGAFAGLERFFRAQGVATETTSWVVGLIAVGAPFLWISTR